MVQGTRFAKQTCGVIIPETARFSELQAIPADNVVVGTLYLIS